MNQTEDTEQSVNQQVEMNPAPVSKSFPESPTGR
jgi:hypothetical protein